MDGEAEIDRGVACWLLFAHAPSPQDGCLRPVAGRFARRTRPRARPGRAAGKLATREMSRTVGEGVSELRIDYGPGYRVYFKRQGRTVVILLAGGDKRNQSDDIETALRLARNL